MMDSVYALREEAVRAVQAYGFYVLCGAAAVYYLWVRVLRGVVAAGVQKARLRAAQEPTRVAALDKRRREAFLKRARRFEAEAAQRRAEGSGAEAKKKSAPSSRSKRAAVSSSREYNPLMGPSASRGYRPTRRVRSGG